VEKRQAFEALAGLVDRIVDPKANVVPLRGLSDGRGAFRLITPNGALGM
jgi:hypothetical protein